MGAYLPKYAVYCVSKEAIPCFRRQKFGAQYRHEFIKIHLSIPCKKKHCNLYFPHNSLIES